MIYIINHEKYKDYYNNSFLKYLFKIHTPKFKGKKLEYISRSKENLGYIGGINLKMIDYSREADLDQFIGHLKIISEEGVENLYMEEIESIPSRSIKKIESETGLRVSQGIDIKINSIPYIIDQIYKVKKENMLDKEVLIIGHKKEEVKKVIELIWKDFNFISLVGLEETMEDVYKSIFEIKGISLFQPKIDSLDLKSYDIIINLWNKYPLREARLNRKTIIFDYSREKPFKRLKNNMVITNINIEVKGEELNLNPILGLRLKSEVYEEIIGGDFIDFSQVLINDTFYDLEKYLISSLKERKGRF